MKNICKKIISPTNIIIVFFSIMFYMINTGITVTDDKVYGNAFNSFTTCINWVQEFYNVWSGRITLTILNNIFVNLPLPVFKIANTAIFISVILSGYKIIEILTDGIKTELKNIVLLVLFCLAFFISIPVINSGCLWIAGAMNYLWPLAGMLISIIPFIALIKDKKVKNIYYIVFILSNLLGAFAEQTAAILIVFGLVSLVWGIIEKKKISKLLIAHYIVIVIFALVSLLAPGNSVRSSAEELKWYSSYSMLSTADKLVQGYINMADHIINNTTMLFAVIAIISSILIISDKRIKIANKVVALIPIIYIIFKILPFDIIQDKLFNFAMFNINTLYSMTALLQLISSSFILLIVAGQLIYVFEDKKNGIITAILYCASLCSALALSFSPTVFVSGNRIFTASDFLFVIIGALLLIKLIQKLYDKKHVFSVAIIVDLVAVFTLVYYIRLCSTGISTIIW